MIKWLSLVLVAVGLLWAHPAAAAGCAINGYTGPSSYKDCVPTHLAWTTNDAFGAGNGSAIFETPQAASQAYFDYYKSPSFSYCSYGCHLVLTPDYTPNGKPGNPPIPVRYFFTMTVVADPNSHLPPLAPPGGRADQVPVCPANYSMFTDLLPGSDNHGVNMCRPNSGLRSVRALKKDLTNPAGCPNGCNPVDLGDLHKMDWVVDYQNQSPYPIVWGRSFSGLGHQWYYNYDRQLSHTPYASTLLTASVTLRRQDGQLISFTGTRPTVADDWTWTPDVGSAALSAMVLGKLTSASDLSSFSLRTHTDETESYNTSGQLVRLQDDRQLPLRFSYDSRSRLSRIDDASGRFLVISYPALGAAHTGQNVDEEGNPIEVDYSSYTNVNDLLVEQMPETVSDGTRNVGYNWIIAPGSSPDILVLDQVIKPDLHTLSYHYDSSGQYLGLTDENGARFSTYAYGAANSNPDTVTQTYHGDHNETLTYTQGGITYPNGQRLSYGTDLNTWKSTGQSSPCSWCGGTQYGSASYDLAANPASITDFNGNQEARVYDQARGVPLSITEAVGTPQERTTTYTWDSRFLKPTTIVKPVQTVRGAGTQTGTYGYDAAGNLTSWTLTVSGPSGVSDTRSGSATYNAFGEPLTMTNARGKVSTYTYDAVGNRLTATDPLGHVTTYGNYDTAGNPGWVQDANGLKVVFTYDSLQRITQVKKGCDPGAGCHWETTSITYNPMGSIAKVVQANGRGLAYHYDTAHRRVQEDILGTDGTALGTLTDTLSASSEVTAKTYKDALGQVIQTQGLGYDDLSRLTSLIDSHAQAFTQTWDNEGNRISSLDPLNHGQAMVYDALSRLTQVTLPDTSTETISYGPDDTVLTQTDARGQITGQAFNGYGEVVGRSSPDSGSTGLARDANGNVLTRMDARGVALTTTYDDLDRPITQTGSASGEQISWAYDNCSHGVGHLCSVTDRTGTTHFAYDLWGRLASKTSVVNGHSFTISYGHDELGQLAIIGYPSGTVLTQTWANGRVVSQQWGTQPIFTSAHYDALDRITDWTWASGRVFSFEHDLDGRISAVGASVGGSPVTRQSYGFDAAWRVNGITRQPMATTTTFDYDNRDRLTSGTTWGSYTYDANSNRLSWLGTLGPMSYRVDPLSDRLASLNGTPVAVDASGNLLTKPGLALSYDDWSRLRTATGTETTTYGVNGLNERVIKTTGSVSWIYMYASVGHLLGVYDGATGAPIEELAYMGDRPVATVRAGGVYPIETDHLMAPLRVLDASNASVWSWEDREPFGASPPTEGAVDGQVFSFGLRFPGQWADAETGLVSNGFRDYDPILGRYLEGDPIGLAGGWNPYGYVRGNPQSYFDPFGLFLWPWEKSVTVTGGTPEQQAQVYTEVNQILSTPRGQEMLEKINGPWYEHGSPQTIQINNNHIDNSIIGGGIVRVDPRDRPCIQSSEGNIKASTQRIVAHEFGHSVMGDKDDGPGQMNNVIKNENPIMNALGQPSRTAYPQPVR